MNEQAKEITREKLYEEIWRMPMSKLAATWGTSVASIVKVCEEMNVPRPESGHWSLVQRGWQVERSRLPAADTKMQTVATLATPQKREKQVERKPVVPEMAPTTPKVKVPKNLDNAHRLVKQTHKALTTDTYLHNGFVHTRSNLDHPLRVAVSPEQLERCLRILDAIIKGVIDRGGRFERGPESWRLRLFMGKQPVEFHVREALKRHDRPCTEEEREAPGFRWREKYDWKGSGVLKFRIDRGEYVHERTWEDSRKVTLEEQAGEIIDALANIEEAAREIRAEEEQRKKREAKQRQREAVVWRRQEAERENRMCLEKTSDEWTKAKRLRNFIRACERTLRDQENDLPADGWQTKWLEWARQHADRIDPLRRGFLESERKRLTARPDHDQDQWEEHDPDTAEV